MTNYSADIDNVPTYKTVVFVGEYFTLMSTVELVDELREGSESDDELAIRTAATWLESHYGWDMNVHSHQAGVIDE
jgi:hypothetical protein